VRGATVLGSYEGLPAFRIPAARLGDTRDDPRHCTPLTPDQSPEGEGRFTPSAFTNAHVFAVSRIYWLIPLEGAGSTNAKTTPRRGGVHIVKLHSASIRTTSISVAFAGRGDTADDIAITITGISLISVLAAGSHTLGP
jgi:hypothetical protein